LGMSYPTRPVRAAVVLTLAAIVPAVRGVPPELDREPINYAAAELDNPVTRLQQKLIAGQAKLSFTDDHGYLRSVLAALAVPAPRPAPPRAPPRRDPPPRPSRPAGTRPRADQLRRRRTRQPRHPAPAEAHRRAGETLVHRRPRLPPVGARGPRRAGVVAGGSR